MNKKGLIVFGLLFLVGLFVFIKFCLADSQLIAEDNFEDGDFNRVDSSLTNGLSWIDYGKVNIGTRSNWLSKYLRFGPGASALSNQVVNLNEYTLTLDSINSYRTPTEIRFYYLDENNYYYLKLPDGEVFRRLDGNEEKISDLFSERYLQIPYLNPSINHYKIYFKNNGSAISIKIDKDGYNNGLDYEFNYNDDTPLAISRFADGFKINLIEKGSGTYSSFIGYDNIKIYDGLLLDNPPHLPTTLYVDQNLGDDSNLGTIGKPFATVGKALNSSLPGDTILVRNGNYGEDILLNDDSGYHFNLKVYATKDNRLTIKAENKWGAKINTADFSYDNYITLDGFEVIGDSIRVGGGKGIWILNNYVHDLSGKIGIIAYGENGIIRGNYILRTNKGMVVSGKKMLVENNEIERLIYPESGGQDADYFRLIGEGHIIRNNYMHGTKQDEIGPSHTDGFQTFDNNGEFLKNTLVEGNFIEDFYAQGFMGEGMFYYNSSNITFRNNIFKDVTAWGICTHSLRDVKVYNNIFIGSNESVHGIGFRGSKYGDPSKPSTGEAYNNIFYDIKNPYWAGSDSSIQGSNNLLFSTIYWYDPSKHLNDIVNKDPLFVNISNSDFHLKENSPAIDSGIVLSPSFDDKDGNPRPQGSGWDIGAYEYVPAAECRPADPFIRLNSTHIRACSCNQTDVQAAIDSAANGDVIELPAGNCIWTNGVYITKDIRILGSGINSTILTMGFADNSVEEAFFKFVPDAISRISLDSLNDTHTFEVSGISFVSHERLSNKFGIWIQNYNLPVIKRVSIHSNEFINIHRATQVKGYVHGVFHHNVLVNTNGAYPQGAGYRSFENDRMELGSGSGWYIEDNVFSFDGVDGLVCGAGNDGGGYVVRYNDVKGTLLGGSTYVETHGNQLSYVYGPQITEVYGNDMRATGVGKVTNVRGGKNLYFFNAFADSDMEIWEEYSDLATSPTNPVGRCPENQGIERQTCTEDCICQKVHDSYFINNRFNSNIINAVVTMDFENRNENILNEPPEVTENIEFFNYIESGFDGSEGVGCGTLAEMNEITNCSNGVGFWVTNQDCERISPDNMGVEPGNPINGALYKCKNNEWKLFYKPYIYPHPLTVAPFGTEICGEGQITSPCVHKADSNCDGKVNVQELINFIKKWKKGEVTIRDVIGAMKRWRSG